jgi:hypothetical protein
MAASILILPSQSGYPQANLTIRVGYAWHRQLATAADSWGIRKIRVQVCFALL